MINKIAVIGDKDSVLAFSSAGADVFGASTLEQARTHVRELSKGGYAVILITEELAKGMPDVLEKAKTKPFPIIVPIPTAHGSSDFGMNGLKRDIEKAIGTDIVFKENKYNNNQSK